MLQYKPTNFIIRLNSDWTWDKTFQIGSGFSAQVSKILVQPDDKIVVIGNFTSYSGSSSNRIARLNADGTRDSTYNVGNGFNSNTPYMLFSKTFPDKTYVVGSFTTYSGSIADGIVRLNSNGTRDASFAASSSTRNYQTINEDSSGSLYVGGINLFSYGGIPVFNYLKLTPSGNIDPAFQSTITSSFYNVTTLGLGTYNGGVRGIYIDSSDNQYIVGQFNTYKTPLTPNAIMIDSQNATFSSSFNIGVQGFSSQVQVFATQSDGKILAGGSFVQYSGSSSNRMIRLNKDGTIDTSFNLGTGFNSTVFNIIVQPDDKIIAIGSFGTYSGSTALGIARININGTRDTTFNVGTGLNFNPNYALALQPDGKIIIGGSFTTYSGSSAIRIARINTNGTLDTTFNTGTGFSTSTPYGFIIQPDGKIIASGNFTTYSGSSNNYIVRINPNGTKDTTFNIGTGFNTTANSLNIQSDGKILAAGPFTSYSGSAINRIVRINPNGTRDTTFNVGTGLNNWTTIAPNSIAINPSGSIYLTSNFVTYSGSNVHGLVKINPSGTRDTSFVAGNVSFNGTGVNFGNSTTSTIQNGNTILLL